MADTDNTPPRSTYLNLRVIVFLWGKAVRQQ